MTLIISVLPNGYYPFHKRYKMFLFAVIMIAIIFFTIFFYVYKKFPVKNTDVINIDILNDLGKKSLETNDVPISSLLIYENKIIGQGYNTAVINKKISEHAEINAINSAINNIGMKNFEELNRKYLHLISSYRPCPMCQGIITLYNIKNVYYIKNRPILLQILFFARSVRFFFKSKRYLKSDFQDKLFEQFELLCRHKK
jgi:tRNA(Arg) A34 adenosine deaminase TadA